MTGDHDELPEARAGDAVAQRHPGLQGDVRRQRQRAGIANVFGGDADRLQRKEGCWNAVGEKLAHPRQIGLRDHDVGAERQMRAVLFGGRQRQDRDPTRRVLACEVGPVDVGPVAGRNS